MSRENVDCLRRAFEEEDRTHELALWVFDPEAEWHAMADEPDSGVHRGVEQIAAYLRDWPTHFDDFRVEGDELIDCGDYVLAPVVLRGRVRGSSQEVTMMETQAYKFRDGRVTEVREYRTTEEALAAIGA